MALFHSDSKIYLRLELDNNAFNVEVQNIKQAYNRFLTERKITINKNRNLLLNNMFDKFIRLKYYLYFTADTLSF